MGKGAISSYDEFFAAIGKGAQLVVLDDWVVDVNKFLEIHPAGPEPLQKYVGKLSTNICRD